MTRTEFIIQLLKLAIGLAFGAYFVWWSLEVLDRLTPEETTVTRVVMATGISPPCHWRGRWRLETGRGAGEGPPERAGAREPPCGH